MTELSEAAILGTIVGFVSVIATIVGLFRSFSRDLYSKVDSVDSKLDRMNERLADTVTRAEHNVRGERLGKIGEVRRMHDSHERRNESD